MIRKSLITLIVLVIFVPITNSQNFRFSYLLNPQIAWLQGSGNNYESKGSILTINTGIETDFFFSDNYAFTTGLTLNALGGGAFYQDSVYLGSAGNELLLPPGDIMEYRLQYICIPIGLKFKTVEIGYITYWVNTGVSSMFGIKSRGTDEESIFNKADLKEDTGVLNFNYFIKAGIEYSIGGNTAIIGGVAYNSGLMDVTNRAGEKLTTQAFSLVVGVLF